MDPDASVDPKPRRPPPEAGRPLLAQIHRSALTIAELRYVAARLRSNRARLADLLDAVERSTENPGS